MLTRKLRNQKFLLVAFSITAKTTMQRIKVTSSPIDRETDSLARYLREIKKVGFLTPEEECKLIREYRAGDLNAMEKIVKANLRFVVSVAKHYQHQGISLADLISEGNIGLMKAVEQYDETRGFKFISYAVWWIRQAIIKALMENSRIIRLPRNKVTSLSKISHLFKQLEQEFEREPTVEELSTILGVEIDVVKTALGYEVKQISIDAPISMDEVKSLLDVIEDTSAELPDNHVVHHESLKTEIRYLLTGLNRNQTEVVKMYYGMDGEQSMNLLEISKKMNLSSERIRQIKDEALDRLKSSKRSKGLKDFLDK
jgi:RNA polymerase primary sigma factor